MPDAPHLFVHSLSRVVLDATIAPGAGSEWAVALQEYVEQQGKFTKTTALYAPLGPPPAFWVYHCDRCRAFLPQGHKCLWVGEEGSPDPGVIKPRAWCAIWMPQEGDKPLSYLKNPEMIKVALLAPLILVALGQESG